MSRRCTSRSSWPSRSSPLAGCTAGDTGQTPLCTNIDDSVFVLLAQSVPSATQLPCVSDFPVGWSFGGSNISRGLGRFWLDSDRGGIHAVEVSLRRSCDTTERVEERPAPDEVATRVFVRPDSLKPSFTGVRFLLFDGGCIGYTFRFSSGAPSTLAIEAVEALSLLPRATIVAEVAGSGAHSLRRRRTTVCGVASADAERPSPRALVRTRAARLAGLRAVSPSGDIRRRSRR